ncbi:hypothetical protein [Cellulomonas pakistanensis]|uniref:Uncharacterized protein n=1 Tax=Cellulomonas pakistanensis TaxID=992287 RepID=A0A919PC85_9CELL|nr:hypothetical protein [Cellulomonas pakistanensis]GIG36259.1 hypothetical protein Cpa01nite_16400 [Cellulomonas pakistanensis]
MTSYELEPEVAGGLGPGTEWGPGRREITRLDYEFDDWLGDDLVTSTPVTLATARVRDAIVDAGLTGVAFAPVIVSRSDLFAELNDRELPEWAWLRAVGHAGRDDAWSGRRGTLTVSDRALALLQQFTLDRCVVTPIAD